MKEVLLACTEGEAAVAKAPALPPAPDCGMTPVTPSNPVQPAAAAGTPAAGVQQVGGARRDRPSRLRPRSR